MNFFPRLVLVFFCLLFFQSSSGMVELSETPFYKTGLAKIFNNLSEKARNLLAHAETSSVDKKNRSIDKTISHTFAFLKDDLNANGETDKWLGNFGLSKDERTALQKPYKGLCQKIYAATLAHRRLEDFSFSSSFHMLNELQGSCVLDARIQNDTFFIAIFCDFLTFKRRKGEMILAGLYNTRNFFQSTEYQEIFIETYQSLLMLNEMRRIPALSLETLKSNICTRIDRDFNRLFFSEEDVKVIQRATAQKVEIWFQEQGQFTTDLLGTMAYLKEISDWPKIPLMGESLGKAHLIQFRDFVQNLSEELDAHLKFVRDLLREEVLSFEKKAPAFFDFLMDDLKRSLMFPPIFEDPSFKVPVNIVLKEEIGITNYVVVGRESAGQGVLGTREFYIEDTEYQISPQMVRIFRDFVWPILPRNVRIDEVTKPEYVPLYSFFGQAEVNALHAQIKAMRQEITTLRGTISEQAIFLKEARAKKAAKELLDSEEREKHSKKISNPNGSKKAAPASAQSHASLELLTKTIEDLRKELSTKDKKLATLEGEGKKRDLEHRRLKLQLCQLSNIEESEASSLDDVINLITPKWKAIQKTVREQEARLKDLLAHLDENSKKFSEFEMCLKGLEQERACVLTLKKKFFQLIEEEENGSTLDALVEKLSVKLQNLVQVNHDQTQSLEKLKSEFFIKEKDLYAKIAGLEEVVRRGRQESSVIEKETEEKLKAVTTERDKMHSDLELIRRQLEKEKSQKEDEKKDHILSIGALEGQITALTAEISDLNRRVSDSVSREMFEPMRGRIYEFSAEIMKFIEEVMTQKSPVNVSKLGEKIAELQRIHDEANRLLPPDRQVVQSFYPGMVMSGCPPHLMGQYPRGLPVYSGPPPHWRGGYNPSNPYPY